MLPPIAIGLAGPEAAVAATASADVELQPCASS
jgi:hypothetical protein